jgi:hypothetical protein
MLYDHDSRSQFSRDHQARLADDARRTRATRRSPLIDAFITAVQKTVGRPRETAAEQLPALER